MYYLVTINPDDTIETTEQDECPTLEQLQGIVGGYLESVPGWTRYEDKPCWAVCNEEGKLEGLPVNQLATAIWWHVFPDVEDVLCGAVLVIWADTAKEMAEL